MHRYKCDQYSIADDFLEIRLDLLEVHLLLVVLNMIRFSRHLGRLGWSDRMARGKEAVVFVGIAKGWRFVLEEGSAVDCRTHRCCAERTKLDIVG
jgi:hypothetical protein